MTPQTKSPRTASKLPPLGAHVSIAGGMPRAIERARSIEATALQIFLKNNNRWAGKPISLQEAEQFREDWKASGLAPPVAHSGYLINLASPDEPNASRSMEAMADELARAALLGVPGVVLHPGAHKGSGVAHGLRTIIERINRLFDATPDSPAGIWLETTAGQGTALGHEFEHLAVLIEGIENQTRIGVCLDTCHVFAAGHDIRTRDGVKAMLRDFNKIIGLDRLRAIHVNDSKQPFNSRRDRHEHIGQGHIGEEGFAALLQDRRLRKIPFILETPKNDAMDEDRMNLATLRRLAAS